jgi:putative transposase
MRKVSFAIGEKYHVYNRGTEKRKIFMDKNDYSRLLFIMELFNKPDHGFNVTRNLSLGYSNKKGNQKLVNIEAFCLMPNHYHLLLEEVAEGGISKFLQKVMTGYAMYFNKKYNRTGSLFQGKAKSKHIDRDSYYMQVKAYIDLNPVELFDKGWKENLRVGSPDKTLKFLSDYKWGSCKNFSIYKKYLSGKTHLPTFEELFD